MIDSVLKGTGNSRFLKSAVPAGTSWADALAMLQAGTFPIDFNGINTEGFQQVGTPLNKANLLKDATAAQIGLPPSATPDGMFRALGNTGELHVWRKTTVTAEPVPAGYKLGKIISSGNATDSGVSITGGYTNAGKVHINRFSAVNVSDDGTVTGDTSATGYSSYPVGQTVPNFDVGGYFLSLTETVNGTIWASEIEKDKIYYVPVGSSWFQGPGSALRFCLTSIQEVIGTPYIPAGTTTTYPVSTNPNAYQEGSDAKPAGYTLGEVVTGKYYLGNANVGYVMSYKTATSLSVSDNGILSMPTDATSFNVTYSKNGLTTDQIKSYFAGKFVQLVAVGSDSVFSPSALFKTAPSEILFIPSNSVVTKDEFKNFNIDRYQPVTGYAAIPAGTTIEYLGKLGDKARVQVVSYVGTGTYGSSNPNSLTFDFVPKCVFLQCVDYGPYRTFLIRGARYVNFKLSESTSSQNDISWNSKTVSWFSTVGTSFQYNDSGRKYIAVAIG